MAIRIHFIGVGKMDLPMASHFLAAGHVMSVSDPSEERLRLAASQGLAATEAGSLAVAIADADAVFSSLPHDATLLDVAAQVAASARRGNVFVDTSTVSQRASADAAAICAGVGVDYLRTTVSGNNKMAEAAQLTVMASGPRAAYDRLLPVLQLLGPNQFYLGDAEQLIVGEGKASHVPLAQTAMTLQLMHAAVAQGDALDDYAAIIKAVERSAGLPAEMESKK